MRNIAGKTFLTSLRCSKKALDASPAGNLGELLLKPLGPCVLRREPRASDQQDLQNSKRCMARARYVRSGYNGGGNGTR
jgi:hypothetical protein